MASKFTFRKESRETGLAAVGHSNPNTIIKLNKKEVGFISGPNWKSEDSLWHVSLMKKSDKPDDCGWRWFRLKAAFTSEPEARNFLNKHFEKVVGIGLFSVEED